MLHFFKFKDQILDPAPARDVYEKRPPGRGWPEECPPMRAANGFGFDVLANFDLVLEQRDGAWRCANEVEVMSDWLWSPNDEDEGEPLYQVYAWFWDKGQKVPHPIDDHVYEVVRHQVKVSSFLYLRTDPNELLLMTEVPNRDRRGWRALTALIETDWYPASYPWHCVLELDPSAKRIEIAQGEPLCRLIPVRRDTYFAQPMSAVDFDVFFHRAQRWIGKHGREAPADDAPPPTTVVRKGRKRKRREEAAPAPAPRDITRTYGRQQARSRFIVLE
ncbi:MAG: DUF6065 family protein [Planctomycetota bacterium]